MGSERLPILSRSAEPTALQSQAGTISRSGLCEREHLPNRLRGHSADRPFVGVRRRAVQHIEKIGAGEGNRTLDT
jgi:hypothetical protein